MKHPIAFLLSVSIGLLSYGATSRAQINLSSEETPLHPDVQVLQPLSGAVLIAGTVTEIKFDSYMGPDTVSYSVDGGVNWTPIAVVTQSQPPATYAWMVPEANSNQVYLRVMEPRDIGGGSGPFTIKPAGSAVSNSALPTEYSLGQNYPNPSTGFSNISYSLPSQAVVSLSVSDLLGREVRHIQSKTLAAGTYSSGINMSGLPNGTYVYTLHANDRVLQGKMILNK